VDKNYVKIYNIKRFLPTIFFFVGKIEVTPRTYLRSGSPYFSHDLPLVQGISKFLTNSSSILQVMIQKMEIISLLRGLNSGHFMYQRIVLVPTIYGMANIFFRNFRSILPKNSL